MNTDKLYGLLRSTALVLNLVCLVPLCLALAARYVPPSEWYVPSLAALLAPWWLAAPLVWGVLWFFFKTKYAVVNGLFLLLGLPLLFGHIQYNSPARKGEKDIRVVSLNVGGFGYDYRNARNLLRDLAEEKPDVVCLQEFAKVRNPKGLGVSGILGEFKKELGLPHHAWVPLQNHDNFGLLVLSRYPVNKFKPVTETGSKKVRNGVMYTEVKLYGQTLRIYNVHLQSYRFDDGQRQLITDMSGTGSANPAADIGSERKAASRRIKKAAKDVNLWQTVKGMLATWRKQEMQVKLLRASLSAWDGPVIVCADLNNPPSSYFYRELTQPDMQDCWRERGSGTGHTYGEGLSAFRIDYILASQQLDVLEYRTILENRKWTDHSGVLARLRLQPLPGKKAAAKKKTAPKETEKEDKEEEEKPKISRKKDEEADGEEEEAQTSKAASADTDTPKPRRRKRVKRGEET